MEKREIYELSYEELVLYEKQLSEELSTVKFRINQCKKAKRYTGLLSKKPSQTTSEEK